MCVDHGVEPHGSERDEITVDLLDGGGTLTDSWSYALH